MGVNGRYIYGCYLTPINRASNKYWLPFYVTGASLALLEWLQILPPRAYFIGFLVALLGSIMLVLLHFILKKAQRRDIATLAILVFFSLVPIIIAQSVFFIVGPIFGLPLSLLALIGLPGAYFYIAYRRQPGWLEIRANRTVGLYIFLILLFIINFTLVFIVTSTAPNFTVLALYLVLLPANTLIAIVSYPPFQRLVDRYLLGMPINRNKLVATYSARITASLDRNNLIYLLHNEVMPSLQILESGIIQRSSGNRVNTLYSSGISPDQIPSLLDFEDLLKMNNQTPPTFPKELSWVKLLIPLRLDGKPIGVWLFGRHDPDDVYSRTDMQLLETLGNQTAIALANIQQTEQLRKLYDANVHRHEEERTALARALHDDVLHSLATLRLDRLDEDRFQAAYKQVRRHIRDLLRWLRPALLDYGLWRAFDEMVDNLQEIGQTDIDIILDIPQSDARYSPEIEQHIFRIVQQAADNALQHAQAKSIRIQGRLGESNCFLIVEDDGVGLPDADPLNMLELLENHHYGLVGMHERAALIGAHLEISSSPGEFTRVTVSWPEARDN